MQAELGLLNSYGQRLAIMIISPNHIYTSLDGTRVPVLQELNSETAKQNNEQTIQLLEGFIYEFLLIQAPQGVRVRENEVIKSSNINSLKGEAGTISPGLYTGLLPIELVNENGTVVASAAVEVRSSKLEYRSDYRIMLEFIAEKCTDLLIQANAPSKMKLAPDPNRNPQTIEQKYSFLKHLLTSTEFGEAIQRIVLRPQTSFEYIEKEQNIYNSFKWSNRSLQQVVSNKNRSFVPADHPIYSKLQTIPTSVKYLSTQDSLDIPENRFVKFVLNYFLDFLYKIDDILKKRNRVADLQLKKDIGQIIGELNEQLSSSFFRDISNMQFIPLNSPILQRREGYREVFQAWLKFDLAASLIWEAGEDVYTSGKKDVALLYEYWVFFKLLELLKHSFDLEVSIEKSLFKQTEDGFSLTLKAGKELSIPVFIYIHNGRNFKLLFSYNKTFNGSKPYKRSGSWTRPMRPDYTLSIWPERLTIEQAEEQELVVHIHLDAKYRVDNLMEIFNDRNQTQSEFEEELEQDKKSSRGGTPAKRADLLKMHAYKDAIRRTAGAYIIYPGKSPKKWKEYYHEILPGIGAFSLRPDSSDEALRVLEEFIKEVMDHLSNRISRREEVSYYNYKIYNDERDILYADYQDEPERIIPPNNILVVNISPESSQCQDWMIEKELFLFKVNGAVNPQLLSVKHAVLYVNDCLSLWDVETEIRILSGIDVRNFGYPGVIKDEDVYIVFKVLKSEKYNKLNGIVEHNMDVIRLSSLF